MMTLREQIDQELKELSPDEQILQNIFRQKRTRTPELRLLLCGVLLTALFAFPVSAHIFGTIFQTTLITDENRALVMEPDIAASEERPADAPEPETPNLLMEDPERLSEATGGVIQGTADGAFLPDAISVIDLVYSEETALWEMPELLTANGFVTVFSQESKEGWYLQKGETLRLHLQTGRRAGADTGTPTERMEIGFIQDHLFYQGTLQEASDFSYTLTAPETGAYYLYCINCSSNKIYIKKGSIVL